MRLTKILVSCAAAVTLTACGVALDELEEQEDGEASNEQPQELSEPENSFYQDANLTQEGASAGMSAALDALADASNNANTGSALALAAAREDNSSYSRGCEVDGGIATVSIEAEIDRSFTWEGRVRQIERTVTGSGELTREWSKEDGDMACASNGLHVDLEPNSNLAGVTLEVEFERNREVAIEFQNRRRGISYAARRSHSAEGSRTIVWTEQTADEEAGTITRTKTIESAATRTHSRENTRGKERSLKLEINTDEDAPLTVKVERDDTTGELASKLIESGKLIITRSGDARLETTFEDVLVTFEDSSCEVQSGTVTYAFYASVEEDSDEDEDADADEESASNDEDATDDDSEGDIGDDADEDFAKTPAKTLVLTFADGSYELVDQDTNEVIDEFEFENCQYSEFFRR